MNQTETPMAEDEPQGQGEISDWEEGGALLDADPGDQLVVDVEGFEGPLDLLLALARTQKVDLAKISVLALAQQYLDFISEARRLRLEIAADYLVMAAWLAFLKSKLLLPAEPSEEGEPTGAELAALLAFRLKRLHAMREVSAQLMTRKRLGRDVFGRGEPEPIRITRQSVYDANVYDLLKAYSQQRQRTAVLSLQLKPRTVWSLNEAREELAAAARHECRLGAARSVDRRVPGRARTAQDGARVELYRDLGDDARGRAGNPPGKILRAAFCPPPRARRMSMIH